MLSILTSSKTALPSILRLPQPVLGTRHLHRKSGFTLVELSIVLVIIGLLISGILVGQSLIESARINAQVQQISQYDAAILSFKTRYKSLPGDASAMGCTSSNCNNGLILETTAFNAGLHSIWYWHTEVSNFWMHLGQSGLKTKETYTATIPAGGFNSGVVKNIPAAILGKNSSILVGAARSELPNNSYYNHYFIADHRNVTAATIIGSDTRASLSPIIALALDQKMDDGLPNVGNVKSRQVDAGYIGTSPAAANCVTASKYVISDEITCNLVVKLLSSTGGS